MKYEAIFLKENSIIDKQDIEADGYIQASELAQKNTKVTFDDVKIFREDDTEELWMEQFKKKEKRRRKISQKRIYKKKGDDLDEI